jgi:hypothetical protein
MLSTGPYGLLSLSKIRFEAAFADGRTGGDPLRYRLAFHDDFLALAVAVAGVEGRS